MKKIQSSIKMLAALLVAGAAFTACSSDDNTVSEQPVNPAQQTYTLTVNATKGSNATTRALEFDGEGALNATWATTENVYVKKGDTWATGSLKPQADGATATLKGTLSGVAIAAGDALTLQFPKSGDISYSGQLGTLANIAANFDYATAGVTVESVTDGNINVSGTASFTNQQAIIKFTLLNSEGSALASNPTAFSITDGTNTVTLSDIPNATYTTNGAGVLYVAFPAAGESKTITLTATVDGNAYTYTTSSAKTFSNGNYYAITVKMKKSPLTLEAVKAGTITVNNGLNLSMNYSKNGGDKVSFSTTTSIDVVAGDVVQFYGNNAAYFDLSTTTGVNISCDADTYIYGNIMSLINEEGFENETTLTEKFAFVQLFNDNTHIKNHSEKKLVLPATTLTEYCYYAMFAGCSALTTAPELPATTLTEYCYCQMFYGCSALATAPELPATTLTDYCYYQMFGGCSALTTAPELPATTLANRCYSQMFYGCSDLTTAPELPATTLAGYCYYAMFGGCSALTSAPELPATTLTKSCYRSMFYGCTDLTTAPELPATTLADECYDSMFYGCSDLTTAPELPATTLTTGCYSNMFQDCTALTTAPELPATTLTEYCYYQMFYGCTTLTTAPELPATTLAGYCYYQMFSGCTALTTAPKLPATTLADECYGNMFNGCSNLEEAWVKAAYHNIYDDVPSLACDQMFNNAGKTGAQLHTLSDNVAGWSGAGSDNIGNFTVVGDYTD